MRIIKLAIENFGIYNGYNEFELCYNPLKKVSLIIGRNGAGKTTFLNAIKTAFYGSMLYGTISITQSYNDFILNILNKEAMKTEPSNFGVSITFISNIIGFDGEYTIQRNWQQSENKVNETLVIYKRNKKLSSKDVEGFLKSLYRAFPLDLFDLFFFDGEKIDRLGILNSEVINLIETAVNIDLYKTLKLDLQNYTIKKSNKNDLKQIENQKQNLLTEIQKLEESKINIENNLREVQSELQEIEKKLNELKEYNFPSLFYLIETQTDELNQQIDLLNKEIKAHYVELTPYSILHAEIKSLLKQLEKEEELKNSRVVAKTMSNELKTDISQLVSNNISYETVSKIIDVIRDKFNEKDKCRLKHNISSDEYYNIKRISKDLLVYNFDQTRLLKKQLNENRDTLLQLKQQLKITQDNEYKIKLDELLKLQSKHTQLNMKSYELEKDYEKTTLIYNTHKNEVQKLESKIWKLIKDQNIDGVLVKLNSVIDRYIFEIKQSKLNDIEKYAINMFSDLIRKDNFISKIHFNDNAIKLEDSKGNIFNHDNLSAGEKQLFVLSILFAIIKISERKVPLVFDTLLGRLDKEHKESVITNFISQCPDQVIILATDVEIDDEFKSILEKQVNQIYEIDFSRTTHKFKLVDVQ